MTEKYNMKTPEYVYLVMYPSDDPLNEPLESFRVNKVFLNHLTAMGYLIDVFHMIPNIEVDLINSERLPPRSREFTRKSVKFEVTAPFKRTYKYAIVKMKLHGELIVHYARNLPFLYIRTLHILDYDPKTYRPETEYESIHSVHASNDSIYDTANSLAGTKMLDWRRPFGHETHHLYSSFIDDNGNTKYLIESSHDLL